MYTNLKTCARFAQPLAFEQCYAHSSDIAETIRRVVPSKWLMEFIFGGSNQGYQHNMPVERAASQAPQTSFYVAARSTARQATHLTANRPLESIRAKYIYPHATGLGAASTVRLMKDATSITLPCSTRLLGLVIA
eukprot:6183975-Pleurochrysis_carterae.AAC.4